MRSLGSGRTECRVPVFARMSLEVELDDIGKLQALACRTRNWPGLEIAQRASLRVVCWILSKGDECTVAKIRRSQVVWRMLESAKRSLLDLLGGDPQALPFRLRTYIMGWRIAEMRIKAYRASGVLEWAPWVEDWLKDYGTVLFLGGNA